MNRKETTDFLRKLLIKERLTGQGKLKPILFNTDMVQAIMDDRKIVTRRKISIDIVNNCDTDTDGTILDFLNCHGDFINPVKLCNYQIEDILYVRETWRVGAWDIINQMIAFDYKDGTCNNLVHINDREMFERLVNQSREDARKAKCEYNGVDFVWEKGKSPCRWRPSIHMPKEAARIWLKVTDVRMERLQDMTLDDFLNEGISIPYEAFNDPENAYMQAKKTFKHIWNSTINKKQRNLYEWDANPLVWVIEFARCKKEIKEHIATEGSVKNESDS